MENLLQRINCLYNKAKVEGLTDEEKEEQQQLRKAYLKKFRANFRNQLDRTKIKELDGTITPLKRKKD